MADSTSVQSPANTYSGGGRPVNPWTQPNAPRALSPTDQAFNSFNKSLNDSTGDYNDIMQKYRDIYSQANSSGAGLNLNYDLNIPTYQTSSDYKNAISNLGDLSKNGGYSDQAIADLRARGVSPIRATYQNAQANIARNKVLQGGYSPNFTAASAKMAREMSSQMADQVTNVNAGIAQNQAQNRLAASVPLASTTAGEQASHNQFDLEQANLLNSFGLNKLNAQIQNYELPFQNKLSALQGMQGMYGTTPALPNMLGNDAMGIAQMQEAIRNNNANRNLQTARLYGGA